MAPGWELPWDLLREGSRGFGLDPVLIASMIKVESGGNTFATRYEPAFSYLCNTKGWAARLQVTEATEEMGQKTSWGLLQIMGATARDMGFIGYFPELCDPKIGLTYGCLKLRALVYKYKTLTDVISAYNAGHPVIENGKYRNQAYVDKVLAGIRDVGEP